MEPEKKSLKKEIPLKETHPFSGEPWKIHETYKSLTIYRTT